MNEIKLLDKDTIDKIAAGEVVDRPASICKELCENSIDAGATRISVEIKNGGISMIRISDNGTGIEKSQIKTAFLRHSTSKIKTAEDLSFITTLGFRGEALSSIAAVSKLELCTKTKDELTGTIYKIYGGEEICFKDAGLPEGTTIIVNDLFYNTPARLKFLKTAQTEAGYITDVIQHIALSNPSVAIKYVVNGMLKINTPGNGSLKDTVYSIFGRDITANLLDINAFDEILMMDGFIGKPEIARSNRNFELYFINGRFVKDKIISSALENAYAGYQMKGTFPFAVLNIHIEPELVDVNVHPSKMEVRFFNSEAVYDSIYKFVHDRLSLRESIPEIKLDKNEIKEPDFEKKEKLPEPFENKRFQILNEESEYNTDSTEPFIKTSEIVREVPKQPELKESEYKQPDYKQETFFQENFISEQAKQKHRIVGEVFDTYWLVEYNNSLFIIDQHAAHEKVLYEKFMKAIKHGRHFSQYVSPSILISLSPLEEETLNKYMGQFEELGFEIEHFGGSEYSIKAVPSDLFSLNEKSLFLDIINELCEHAGSSNPETLKNRIATAACKAAVKGGNRISLCEADALIGELLTLENPYNCPHGRPTIITMTKQELEKSFKRII